MRRPWLRVLAEVVLVFLSILAAFSLETWRVDRGEIDRELIILAGMVPEFEAAEAEASDLLEDHLVSRAQFVELHRLLHSGDGVLYPDSTLALTERLWTVSAFRPQMPVYENLLSSDGLGFIRSDSLRTALRGYELTVRANRDWDDYLRAYDEGLMVETLASRLPLFTWAFEDDDFGGPLRPDVAELSMDMEFRNLIAIRANAAAVLVDRRSNLIDRLQEVRRLLDSILQAAG